MTDRIDEIRVRLASATPGPWEYQAATDGDPGNGPTHHIVLGPERTRGFRVARTDWDRQGDADAEFIANAPTDIAYLLGVADDAQDAIYVLAGCVAKEREENDRLQSRLQRAEALIQSKACPGSHAAHSPSLRFDCACYEFRSEGQQ